MIEENSQGLQKAPTTWLKNSNMVKKPFTFQTFFRLSAATALVCSSMLISTGSQAKDEVPLMNKVVVTASRQAEKIAVISANVTVITEEKITQSPAATVTELLRVTAGVLVNDITGNGRNVSVDLRGFGETAPLNTLLLIDGRRVNQADLSGVDWTLIPKDRIKQIEIIHGGRGSVLYGDNAAGGVINIITKNGEEFKVSAGLEVGSYRSLNSRAAISGSTEKTSYSLNSNFRTSDGYRDNSDTEAKDIGLNLDYFASDRFNLAISGGYHEDDSRLPGSLLLSDLDGGMTRTASKTPNDFANVKDYYLQVSPQIFFTETSYFKLDGSVRNKESDAFSSYTGGYFDAHTEIDTIAISPQLALNEKLLGHNSKIFVGFDYSENKENLHNKSSFFGTPSTASYELTKENWGVYGNIEVAVNEKLSASGGFRHDRAEYTSLSSGVSASVEMEENLYNAGLTYQLFNNTSTYISYAKSFRYPVLDEMFSFFTNTFNNALTPQTTDDFEMGTRIEFDSGLNISANLFRLVTESEIFFNPGTFANENMANDTIRQGIELKASKQVAKVLLSGSYTLRDTKIDGGAFDGNKIPNVPTHQFTLGAEAKLCKKIRLNVDSSYIGERPFISDFNNSSENQKNYFYVAAKLAYMFEKGSAFISVKNLLNDEYTEFGGLNFLGSPGGQPSPKINFLVGVDLDF